MRHFAIASAGFWLAGLAAACELGDDKDKVVLGRMFSPIGTLLVGGRDRAWELPHLFDDIHGERQLLALPGARGIVDLKEGDVHLILAGNLPELSPSTVLETAAVLHDTKSFDLDMTLERGRIIVQNQRKDGPVKVRVRVQKIEIEVTLEKKAAFAVESFGRHVPGGSFKDARASELNLSLLVLKGKVETVVNGKKYVLAGPAVLHWSGNEGPRPHALKEWPAWIDPGADLSARATSWHKAVEGVRRGLAERKALNMGLADAWKDIDPRIRSVALFWYGALGDLDKVVEGLSDAKFGEVRRAAVGSLQHELGHSADFAKRLHAILIGKGFSVGQADIVLNLLQGFSAKDLGRTETYQTLINFLRHDKLAVRELAAWALYRLVPQGKSISYDAAGTEEQRRQGQAEWRALIPQGQLPPRPRS
jgi:hypothetical protein